MDFLNKFSTEPSLGWTIPHLYDKNTQVEVHWMYDKTTQYNWYLKKKEDEAWNNFPAAEMVTYLIDKKLDLSHFELELLRVICVQAVCSHYYIERASELIGKDKIDSAIKVITEILDEKKQAKKAPRLKVISFSKKKKEDEEEEESADE